MPALKCPSCGYSDLHAVDVETIELDSNAPGSFRREHQQELACKRCGWTPTLAHEPQVVLSVKPADHNV
jgi:predicted nucleic-acid-binding Zn-ribbon protein